MSSAMGAALSSATTRKAKKAPQVSVTEADRAVLSLKTQRRKLEQYVSKLERAARAAGERARAHAARGERDGALRQLRAKRGHEALAHKTAGMLFNVEQTLAQIEDAQVTGATLSAMQAGAAELKRLQSAVPLEEVEAVADAAADAHAHFEKVGQVLGIAAAAVDDAALEAELGQLEAALGGKEAEELPAVPTHAPARVAAEAEFPDAPTHAPEPAEALSRAAAEAAGGVVRVAEPVAELA